jgi:hypothetical protein
MLASTHRGLRAAHDRPDRARTANEHIAGKAEAYKVEARVPMLCECSDERCDSLFLLSAADYRSIRREARSFLTAPEHRLEGASPHRREPDYWVQRRAR